MNLSKSKYCRGIQCKKMLWLEKYHPEVKLDLNNQQVLEQGNAIHEVARYLFGEHINIEYTENLHQMVADTYCTIESYPNITITEASFNYQNNFCSVDILKKIGNKYEIYEVKSSTSLKDIYLIDTAYQYYVLTNLGLNVTKCSVIVLNNKYVRHGSIKLTNLFITQDITSKVLDLQATVNKNIQEINDYLLNDTEPFDEVDLKCFKPYPCPFFKYCTKHLPDDNVFTLANMHTSKKIKLYKAGVSSYPELLNSDINDSYKQQIKYQLSDYPDYIDKPKIREFLRSLSYPLYFLDFETYQTPVPLYDNLCPYEKVPFQYSLHYIDSPNSHLNHREFLAEPGTDPRRSLAEQLVADIQKDVCILAYNMAFEKSVIKKLATLYPDLSDHLMNLYHHIKDLMIPFKKRYYYNKAMQGSYSIKYVLPALFPNDDSLNYQNLDQIHNGTEAMNSFLALANMDDEALKYTQSCLLKYCELDTYAMVKIFEKLQEVIK